MGEFHSYASHYFFSRLTSSAGPAQAWNSLMRCPRPVRLDDLRIPLFRHRSKLELRPTLESLGVTDAFEEGAADFAGVNGDSNDLWLTAFSQLNEFRYMGKGMW